MIAITESAVSTVRDVVREALNEREFAPKELVDLLRARTGYTDRVIRQAIWRLLDGRQIRVTSARKFAALIPPARRSSRGKRYGLRWMSTWPHVSLGVSVHLWPLKFAHVSLHLPVGVLVVGYQGVD